VIVSSDLRIRRFTPMAERILNLIPGDVGRPIGHIKPNLNCPDLEKLIVQAVDAVAASERTVSDPQGHRFSMRIRPYKDVENRIDGAVLTLFDLESVKRDGQVAELDEVFADAILETSRTPLLVLDGEQRVRALNPAFRRMMGLGSEVVAGKSVYSFAQGAWELSGLRRLLEMVSEKAEMVENASLELPVAGGTIKTFILNLRRTVSRIDDACSTVIAFEEASFT
jgi:two-component system CheB/CheR fusion protein